MIVDSRWRQRSLVARVVVIAASTVMAWGGLAAITPEESLAQACTRTVCTMEALRPTCGKIPAEGLDPAEKLTVAIECSCCTKQGTQESCSPDDKLTPALAVFQGTTKVTGAFKPAGLRCSLRPAQVFDTLLGPGKYTVKLTNYEGMVLNVTVAGDEGGCSLAPAARAPRPSVLSLVLLAGLAGILSWGRRRHGSKRRG